MTEYEQKHLEALEKIRNELTGIPVVGVIVVIFLVVMFTIIVGPGCDEHIRVEVVTRDGGLR